MKKKPIKQILAFVLAAAMLFGAVPASAADASEKDAQRRTGKAHVSYRTHVQTYGWQENVTDGKTSGTIGQSKRLEAIEIQLDKPEGISGGVEYRTHIQGFGWEGEWKKDGSSSGTSNQSKRLEAIQIRLTGEMSRQYDIYYRVHAQTYGWLGWAKNGEKAGTSGQSKRLEAIQIVLTEKGAEAPGSTNEPYKAMKIQYATHIQDHGWQNYVSDGAVSGTIGESRRLEGIRIQLNQSEISGSVEYRTHIQTYGWEDGWKRNGEMSGTQGEHKRLEAIEIRLTGEAAEQYDIYYRVHAQTYGWLGWAKNGESAGTSRLSRRLEAIEIQLVKKGEAAPGSTDNAYISSEWNTTLTQQGETTLVSIKPGGAEEIIQNNADTTVKVTAAIKYKSKVIRQQQKEMRFSDIPAEGFDMDFGTYGKFYVTIEYKIAGTTVETQQQVFGVTASEYNLAPLSATFPVLYFSLSLWDINVSQETGKQIPTIVMLSRASAYDWDQLPEGVYGVPYLSDEDLRTKSDHIAYAQYIKDLYEVSPDSKFHLFINDIDCSFIHWGIYANRIPQDQYTITMLSDGSATFSIMNETYGVENPEAKHQELIKLWNDAKEEAYRTGTFGEDWGWHAHWECMYAVLSCEPGTQWWVSRDNLFTSGDDNAFAEKIKSDVTVKNINTMLQDLTAKGEETVNEFKALYNFNDEYFADAEEQNKKVMLLLGTYVYNEKSFEDYARMTKMYYGEDYLYYYKGHPNTPTGLYPEKQEELDRLGITDVDSSVAAELILFFNPEIRMSGYGSSTFNSASEEMACGLFEMRKSDALSPESSVDYSGIDWFASYIDKATASSAIASLAQNDRCYLMEFSDAIIAEKGYDIAVYDAENNTISYYRGNEESGYELVS